MIPTYENLDRITVDDLQALIDDGISEGPNIDFKSEPWPNGQSGNKEWCKDISAMANTDGGCIIIGMLEEESIASGIDGIDGNIDNLFLRLNRAADSTITPRISISHKTIRLLNNRTVLIITTPKSRYGPHMTKSGGDNRFYKRSNSNNELMDTDELRRSFNSSSSHEEVIISKHQDHVRNMRTSGEDEYAILLDFFPIPQNIERINPLQHGDRFRHFLTPQISSSYNSRIAFDGYVTYSHDNRNDFETRLLRNGTILSHQWYEVYSNEFTPNCKQIRIKSAIKLFADYLEMTQNIYQHTSINSPFYACLSIIGCKGYYATLDHSKPIDINILEFPPIYIEEPDMNPYILIRPWAHYLCNAFGRFRCPMYDPNTEQPDLNWL